MRIVKPLCFAMLGTMPFSVSAGLNWGVAPSVIDIEITEELHYTPSPPTKINLPDYPFAASNNEFRGWVKLNLHINQDGKVSDAQIIDSNGIYALEQSALKAVKDWEYPASQSNGVSTTVSQAIVQIDFENRRPHPIASQMMGIRYERIIEFIQAGQLKKALGYIKGLERSAPQLYVNEGLINRLYARYYLAKGDELKRQTYLKRAFRALRHLDTELRDMVALELMESSAKNGDYDNVIDVYVEVFDKSYREYGKKAKEIIDKVLDIRENDPSISRQIAANNRGFAYHVLNKKHFSVVTENADKTRFHVSCGGRVTEVVMGPGQIASVPDNWGECLVTFEGMPEKRLELTEFDAPPS